MGGGGGGTTVLLWNRRLLYNIMYTVSPVIM